MSTSHIRGEKGDFAKIVIMPGDPLRAKRVADNFLENVRQVNDIRNMLGFTGTYKGKEVSVMGSGMGIPSIGIYSYELFTEYDVDCIIRVGSAGAYVGELDVQQVVLAESAWSESSYAHTMSGCTEDTLYPDPEVFKTIKAAAEEMGEDLRPVKIHSSDVFYRVGQPDYKDVIINEKGCAAVEMESFALFHNANVLGKKAACILTISDSFVKPEILTPEERQNSFIKMMTLALETARRL